MERVARDRGASAAGLRRRRRRPRSPPSRARSATRAAPSFRAPRSTSAAKTHRARSGAPPPTPRASIALSPLPAGTYTVTVTFRGLSPNAATLDVTLNRVVTFDVTMQVGGVQETVAVSVPALDPSTSATAHHDHAARDRRAAGQRPQLPRPAAAGARRRHQPAGRSRTTTASNPVLGERSGNNNFLLDGQSNKDTVNGGPAQQFNQETIAEFQVLTSGYKAEFGQASGAIVNVITKSGGNLFNGVGSLFFRDDALDASNSLDQTRTEPLPLRRYDSSLALGGPLRQGQGVLLRLGGAHRREPPAGFQVSGHRQRGGQPAAARAGSAVRRADGALGDARVLQARRARRPAPVDASRSTSPTAAPASFLPLSSANSLPSARNDTDTHAAAASASATRRCSAIRPTRSSSRCAPRIRAREQRDAPVADGFDRVDALQSV